MRDFLLIWKNGHYNEIYLFSELFLPHCAIGARVKDSREYTTRGRVHSEFIWFVVLLGQSGTSCVPCLFILYFTFCCACDFHPIVFAFGFGGLA